MIHIFNINFHSLEVGFFLSILGRAIRHIDDYAAVLLVDTRYVADSSTRNFSHPTSKLPQWIKDRFIASADYGQLHRLLHQFFSYNKKRWSQL